jgi:hypothetical protein
MRAAATTISLAGPVWRRARHTEEVPYYESSPWAGAPSRPQPTDPNDAFRQAGYSVGLTRFGSFPEGRSAAFLLAQEHAQTTSYGYGYKWARFLAYRGTGRYPQPASVETLGCYLGYLFMQGGVPGTSIRPCLAAIRSMHTRTGFPSPTEYLVIAALRASYILPTADRFASRPSSVDSPAALGHLALTGPVRSRRPTIDAAIAVGFLFALKPMSISGLQSDDLSLTATNAFIRLRREKGNREHSPDRVLRFHLSTTAIMSISEAVWDGMARSSGTALRNFVEISPIAP